MGPKIKNITKLKTIIFLMRYLIHLNSYVTYELYLVTLIIFNILIILFIDLTGTFRLLFQNLIIFILR
jgi:hypothetical protein